MSHLFIESLEVRDGKALLLDLHQERVNKVFVHFFASKPAVQLIDCLNMMSIDKSVEASIPYKLRLVYAEQILSCEWKRYEERKIYRFHLVEDQTLRYDFKYEDKSGFEKHKLQFAPHEDIIITQGGYLTDASYANLVLYDGKCWVTPSRALLRGVRRGYLLDTHQIKEKDIHVNDLSAFQSFKLINAILDLETSQTYEMGLGSLLF